VLVEHHHSLGGDAEATDVAPGMDIGGGTCPDDYRLE
jgi:hypothetical protein